MYIHTVWATRKNGVIEPELVTAWDEYCVDANFEGFEDDWREAVKSWGTDLAEYRHIRIYVPEDAIGKAFETNVVVGDVP